MTSEQLYLNLSTRDYSESDEDLYAQELQTMFQHFSTTSNIAEFFLLLEKSHLEGKKLILTDEALDEYSIDDVTFS